MKINFFTWLLVLVFLAMFSLISTNATWVAISTLAFLFWYLFVEPVDSTGRFWE